jgi:hypothetical protein
VTKLIRRLDHDWPLTVRGPCEPDIVLGPAETDSLGLRERLPPSFDLRISEIYGKQLNRLSNPLVTVATLAPKPNRYVTAGQIAEGARGENAARLGRRLKTRSDVDAVTENVLAFDDDVAGVQAGAQDDRLGGEMWPIWLT